MREGLLIGLLALASACDGGTTTPPGGQCETLRSCCPSGPLGGVDECNEVVAAGDASECMFYLEDARAEGQCAGGGGMDAGPGGCVGLDQPLTGEATCCEGLFSVASGDGFVCRGCIMAGGMGCNGEAGVAPCCNALYCRPDPGTTGVCSPCIALGQSCQGGGLANECCGSDTGNRCAGVFPSLTCQQPE